jgi:hypothetical protein
MTTVATRRSSIISGIGQEDGDRSARRRRRRSNLVVDLRRHAHRRRRTTCWWKAHLRRWFAVQTVTRREAPCRSRWRPPHDRHRHRAPSQDVKDTLNDYTGSDGNDAELQQFIDALSDVVEYIAGPVRPQQFVDEWHDGVAPTLILLYNRPLLSVDSVTEYSGVQSVHPELSSRRVRGPTSDAYGYFVRYDLGTIQRTAYGVPTWFASLPWWTQRTPGLGRVAVASTQSGYGQGRVKVTYTAGKCHRPGLRQAGDARPDPASTTSRRSRPARTAYQRVGAVDDHARSPAHDGDGLPRPEPHQGTSRSRARQAGASFRVSVAQLDRRRPRRRTAVHAHPSRPSRPIRCRRTS